MDPGISGEHRAAVDARGRAGAPGDRGDLRGVPVTTSESVQPGGTRSDSLRLAAWCGSSRAAPSRDTAPNGSRDQAAHAAIAPRTTAKQAQRNCVPQEWRFASIPRRPSVMVSPSLGVNVPRRWGGVKGEPCGCPEGVPAGDFGSEIESGNVKWRPGGRPGVVTRRAELSEPDLIARAPHDCGIRRREHWDSGIPDLGGGYGPPETKARGAASMDSRRSKPVVPRGERPFSPEIMLASGSASRYGNRASKAPVEFLPACSRDRSPRRESYNFYPPSTGRCTGQFSTVALLPQEQPEGTLMAGELRGSALIEPPSGMSLAVSGSE